MVFRTNCLSLHCFLVKNAKINLFEDQVAQWAMIAHLRAKIMFGDSNFVVQDFMVVVVTCKNEELIEKNWSGGGLLCKEGGSIVVN